MNISVAEQGKISVTGNNGTGKSTLLKRVVGDLSSSEGSIMCSSNPYYIPQHSGLIGKTVAEALGTDRTRRHTERKYIAEGL